MLIEEPNVWDMMKYKVRKYALISGISLGIGICIGFYAGNHYDTIEEDKVVYDCRDYLKLR